MVIGFCGDYFWRVGGNSVNIKKNWNFKIANCLLYTFQYLLIVFSFITFFFVFFSSFCLGLDISLKGLKYYLNQYAEFGILYSATFAVISVKFAFDNLLISNKNHQTTLQNNHLSLWSKLVMEFLNEIKKDDIEIYRTIKKELISMHEFLYEKKFHFANKEDLKTFLDTYFTEHIKRFEDYNAEYIPLSVYTNKNQSYSIHNFRFVFFAMLDLKNCYSDFKKDFEELYMTEVKKFNKRNEDLGLYNRLKYPSKLKN